MNTIQEEADEDVEPLTDYSLALKDKVITCVEAYEHKIGEAEERRRRTIMQPSEKSSVLATPIILRNQCLSNYNKMNDPTHHCQRLNF